MEGGEEAGAQGVIDEGGAQGFAIAGVEFGVGPVEVVAEARVFLFEGHVGDGARVGVDAEGDIGTEEAIDGVFAVAGAGAGLHVAAGAHFEMNALGAQMIEQCGIFDAAYTVADARGGKGFERFPYAVGTARFAGMRCTQEAAIDGVAKGGDMRVDGKAGFVACDVESNDAAALEVLDETDGFETLLRGEVTKGAENEPCFEAGGADALFGGSIHGTYDGFRRESVGGVQKRGKAEFGVDDVVREELLEDILGDQAQGFFGLHQLKPTRCPGEEVGQARALGWCDELRFEFVARD